MAVIFQSIILYCVILLYKALFAYSLVEIEERKPLKKHVEMQQQPKKQEDATIRINNDQVMLLVMHKTGLFALFALLVTILAIAITVLFIMHYKTNKIQSKDDIDFPTDQHSLHISDNDKIIKSKPMKNRHYSEDLSTTITNNASLTYSNPQRYTYYKNKLLDPELATTELDSATNTTTTICDSFGSRQLIDDCAGEYYNGELLTKTTSDSNPDERKKNSLTHDGFIVVLNDDIDTEPGELQTSESRRKLMDKIMKKKKGLKSSLISKKIRKKLNKHDKHHHRHSDKKHKKRLKIKSILRRPTKMAKKCSKKLLFGHQKNDDDDDQSTLAWNWPGKKVQFDQLVTIHYI
ncbi:hypothetical protein DERF_009396 [Dermatophagoides farinae]|uniref:Uncharacterized protein n=1 Tax=Dermatophagoides farinae TaxID=6954 RepID=A0A922HUW0_DERFA|nr:hypothetical protein HUG17_7316 [Dermatophagoides farinae]KAH9510899.1 hypothetical protein DERF_009396 [Dermatophagoides farinae]